MPDNADSDLPVAEAGNPAKATSVRYLALFLVALVSMSAYLTRHCIAVANTTIQAELHLTTEQMGWVLSAFSFGYFFCQVPGGWLGNRFGTRAALPFLSVLWSAFTVWSAAVASFVPLWGSRVAFGMAQAGLVPLASRIVRDWLPLHRRGMGSGVMASAMTFGGVVTVGLTAILMESFDWRLVFRMYSVVGALLAVSFYVLFRTRPQKHPWVNRQEVRLIFGHAHSRVADRTRAETEADAETEDGTAGRARSKLYGPLASRVIKSRSLQALCAHAFFRAAGYGLFVTWFPAFLEKGYGVTRESAGLLAMAPLIATVLGTALGGFLVDLLLRWTGSKWISRSGVACSVLGVCALCTLGAAWSSSVNQLVAAIAVGTVFSGMGNPAYWAATMDLAGRHTAVIMGIVNMAGTLGAFLVPALLGYLIGDIERTAGDWNQVIYLFSAIYFAGAVCGLGINPNASLAEAADSGLDV